MKKLIQTILLFTLFGSAYAQRDLMVYGFDNLAQSNLLNPGFVPDGNIIIGLPAISNNQVQFSNSAFSIDEVLTNENGSSVLNFDNFLNSLDDVNSISLNTENQVVYIGFKIANKVHFNFSASQVGHVNFSYPKTLIEFIGKGNGSYIGETMSFNDLLINAYTYTSYNFGLNYKVNERLSVGGRVKLLNGQANINTEYFNINLYTAPAEMAYAWTISGQTKINTAGIETTDYTIDDFLPDSKRNGGFAFDFGADYKISEKLSVNAAVNNLGSIKWNTRVMSIQADLEETTFEGIDVSGLIVSNNNSQDDTESSLNNFVDTLQQNFNMDTLREAYTTKLSPRIYLGGRYELTQRHQFSGTLYTEIEPSTTNYALSLGYQFYPVRKLGIGACYTLYNKDVFNLGVGFYGQLGPLQAFVVSDDLFNSMRHIYGQEISFRFGINLVVGNKDPEKKALKNAS